MTLIDYLKSGKIPDEIKYVAKKENRSVDYIKDGMLAGRIVIPKNRNHTFPAKGIGEGLSTKINANIGTSELSCNLKVELEKLQLCVKYGADSVMDLSTGGNLELIRNKLLEESPVMFGTVPIYSVVTRLIAENKEVYDFDSDDLLGEIELQAKAGVDFMTLHCGITQEIVNQIDNTQEEDSRLISIVSRGGSLIKKWISVHKSENPLYKDFGKILEICREYDVTVSLGDGLRPGSSYDSTDSMQISELINLGKLVQMCRKANVQVMVEGPGHVPLNHIEANVRIQKQLCKNAPFYVLGPLVTDIAPGYDHITGAIGGAVAAWFGADFLCYVTPAEHLTLPDTDDVVEGVISSKIAAHSADIAKNIPFALKQDNIISRAREKFDWETIYDNSINPEKARKRRMHSESAKEDYCNMCGKLCAIKINKE